MRVVRGLSHLACVCVLALAASATASQQRDEADRDVLSAFVERSRDADIVVLGEIHDNPEHHRVQAEIVAALGPAAIVFEMIPQEREAAVNELRAAGADRAALAAALDWDASGWPDFDFYADILDAAPTAQVFGAGQPAADVRRAMLEGAAGVFGPDARIYGIDQPLDAEEQAAREAIQAAAHCDLLPAEMMAGMVEAQRFRDAGLADAALWARIMTGGGQVVVIAGSAHADKVRGMPAMIALAAPEATVMALGQFEGDALDMEAERFDAVLHAPPPPRDDPCAQIAAPDPAGEAGDGIVVD
mgnify:CR=1 FL=1